MVKKKEFIWNMIASICASCISMVLLFLITRINGVTIAGMFAICFATATVLNSFSDFGMRVFQVTDTTRTYKFKNYLAARYVVNILMILASILAVVVAGYEQDKSLICLFLVFFRFADGISETYQGEFQLQGCLDAAGRSVVIRMIAALLAFLFVDLYTKDVLIAIVVMCLVDWIGHLIYDNFQLKKLDVIDDTLKVGEIGRIIIECFPLFISTLLNNYIVNAPKYAIDRYLSYEIQTYFNILYLPTFTINLMSIFVLKPLLKVIGERWNNHEYGKFSSSFGCVFLIIFAITLVVEVVSYYIGIPILNIIYNVQLNGYKKDLLILIVGGGLSALSVALFYGLTAMRRQKSTSVAYGITAICAMVFSCGLVKKYDLRGAVYSSLLVMLIQTVLLGVLFLWYYKMELKYSR